MLRSILFCLFLAAAANAVPVNDNFASRIALGSGANATGTGSNAGATLQARENDLDSIGGASVWWKWVAPATAWVSVDTIGSEIDTVLAVSADGPTLDDTFTVGFNDESGAPDAPFGSSRVIFRAVAGMEYHFAVHGFLGEQGNVSLHISSGVPPPIRVTSLTLTPGSVNITAAAQNVTADIGIECDASFEEGELAVHKANFSGIIEIPMLPANRISGTPTAGIYRVVIPVSRFSSPGTWFLEVAASDTVGHQAVFGRGVSAVFEYDHVLPDGSPGIFSVANSGAVDNVAPILLSFGLTPTAVNVSLSPATITFTFRVTDTLAGFGGATLTLFTPAGETLTSLPITAAQRILGNTLDGTYNLAFPFPAKMPAGLWSATLLIRDATGNPALYDGAVNGLDFPLGTTSAQWTTVGAPNSYWAWIYPRLGTTPGALPAQDFDGDGISNLLEFAFGLSPDDNDSASPTLLSTLDTSGLPAISLAGGVLSLDYVRRNASALSGLTYTAQFGDLQNSWLDTPSGTVVSAGESFERITISDPAPGSARRTARVKVTLAE